MSNRKILLKNSLLNVVGYVYLLVASFFSISWILRGVGSNMFGVYALFTATILMAATFDFGIGQAVIRNLALPQNSEADKLKIWRVSLWIFLITGIALVILVSLASLLMRLYLPDMQSLGLREYYLCFFGVGMVVFLNHLNSHFLTLPQADQRFDVYNLRTIFTGTGNTVVSGVAAITFHSVGYIFIGQVIMQTITFATMISYARNRFGRDTFSPKFDPIWSKNLINFGLRGFLGNIAGQIQAQFSKYALGGMLSAGAVTAFTIPQSLVYKAAGAISQMALAFFPFGASLSRHDQIKKLKSTFVFLQIFIFCCSLVGVYLCFNFGYLFLLWWLKDAQVVNEAYPVLKIMSIFLVSMSLTPLPSVVVSALDYPQIPSYAAVATVIIEITLIIFFIPRYGVLGPAYAALVASLVTTPPFLLVCWLAITNKGNFSDTKIHI